MRDSAFLISSDFRDRTCGRSDDRSKYCPLVKSISAIGLENDDALVAIDTLTNNVIATSPIGQGPQAIAYVPNAVPEGDGLQNLEPPGIAGQATHLELTVPGKLGVELGRAPTSVSLFDQGLTQVLEASVTGLEPRQSYVLALAARAGGDGPWEPLAAFMTNPAGSAVVNAVGPIRQILTGDGTIRRRYLVILSGTPAKLGPAIQIQTVD